MRKHSNHPSNGVTFEALEARQLRSATPLGFSAESYHHRLYVETDGTNDQITISQKSNRITLTDDNGSQRMSGKFTCIDVDANGDQVTVDSSVKTPAYLVAGSGNNILITGARGDCLVGGDGSDDLVAISGKGNTLIGGEGPNDIWTNGGNTICPTDNTAVHTVTSFINTTDLKMDGKAIAEPAADTDPSDGVADHWDDISRSPLFSQAGPSADDVVQGADGDCYLLAGMSAVAQESPQHIRDIITPMGDGTFAVQFTDSQGNASYVRVDGKVPVTSDDDFLYTEYGADDSIWAPIMEKAFTYFRASENAQSPSYSGIESGDGDEGLVALGGQDLASTQDVPDSFATSQDLATFLSQGLDDGEAEVIGTDDNGVDGLLIADHEYTVASVQKDDSGNITGIWVRNPWGVDQEDGSIAPEGSNDGQNDGYVLVTPDQLFSTCNDLDAVVV